MVRVRQGVVKVKFRVKVMVRLHKTMGNEWNLM